MESPVKGGVWPACGWRVRGAQKGTGGPTVGRAPTAGLTGSENDSAGDASTAEVFQDGVRVGQRARGNQAADFACRCHIENFAEILTSAHSGGLDADFRAGH